MVTVSTHGPVGRFAPSPSGRMHAGNIFAALVAWILVKRSEGKMLLRIDDLDRSRCTPEHCEMVMRDLEMLGFDWSGEVVRQSERTDAYKHAFEVVCTAIRTYPCFCTRSDIQAASAPHANGFVVYPGTCSTLDDAERALRQARLAAEGRMASIRVSVPDSATTFIDELQGPCTMNAHELVGDFVIRRSDGGFAYHLATVVDDAFQGVTHVCRGCDLLASTHVHMLLQDILGLDRPTYAHIPLLMSASERRLAKRDRDAGLDELLFVYSTPEAVLGHIAFVTGLVPADEPTSAEQLLAYADIDRIKGVEAVAWH